MIANPFKQRENKEIKTLRAQEHNETTEFFCGYSASSAKFCGTFFIVSLKVFLNYLLL